ncbi:hypothetical protein [Micromonospora sp. NPDC002717]|uniref:hypothetical protein n=1 Tax=Micromonospora sp. NPDC002717 TaxID=3154424 RepID=UPI00332C81AB
MVPVRADGAGAGGEGEVVEVEAGALLRPGAGVEQHGHDRGVADAAAVGGAFHRSLLLRRERVGLAGARHPDALDLQP